MADRPIIFSAPMVRALLEGRKTQTRRVLKNVPEAPAMDNIAWPKKKLHPAPYVDAYCGAKRTAENPRGMTANWAYWTRDDRPGPLFRVGFVPGDRLWVREAFNAFQFSQDGEAAWPVKIPTLEECKEADELGHRYGAPQIVYRESDRARQWFADQKWRPSIHMPRWASRLTLTVTDVRVQRLQDISTYDVEAEGACEFACLPPTDEDEAEARSVFRDLWTSLHGPDAWDANPWVAAISFTVARANIDKVGVGDA